jgi:hypothetical protein
VEIFQLTAFRPFLHRLSYGTASFGPRSSLLSLGADPTENTASNSFYIVVIGDCLAIARISLTCLPAVTKQRIFLLAIVAWQRYSTLHYLLSVGLIDNYLTTAATIELSFEGSPSGGHEKKKVASSITRVNTVGPSPF